MIKVNLARLSGSAPVHAEAAVTASAPSRPTPLPLKLLLIFALPIGLYIWQDIVVSEKIKSMKSSEDRLVEIKAQVEKLGAVTAVVQGLSREKARLQKQLSVIGRISGKRAFKLKTISEAQKLIPEDCWFEEVSIAKGKVKFKGYSRTPSSVQKLVDELERLEFLSSAYNEELKRSRLGQANVHAFNIVAEVKR